MLSDVISIHQDTDFRQIIKLLHSLLLTIYYNISIHLINYNTAIWIVLMYGYEYKQFESRIIFLVQIPMSSMDAQQRYTHDTKFQEYAAREECNVVLRPYVRRHSVTYSMDIQQQQPEHALEVNYSVHSHNIRSYETHAVKIYFDSLCDCFLSITGYRISPELLSCAITMF